MRNQVSLALTCLLLLFSFNVSASDKNPKQSIELFAEDKGAAPEEPNAVLEVLADYGSRKNGYNYERIEWDEKSYKLLIYKHSRWGCARRTNGKCGKTSPYTAPVAYERCSFWINSVSARGQWAYGVLAPKDNNQKLIWSYWAVRTTLDSSTSSIYTRGELIWLDVDAPDELRAEICTLPADSKEYATTNKSFGSPLGWSSFPRKPWPDPY